MSDNDIKKLCIYVDKEFKGNLYHPFNIFVNLKLL